MLCVVVMFQFFFFFKQKTAYEISACLVGSEMCIRDSFNMSDNEVKGLKLITFHDHNELLIGRDKDAHIQLKDSSVSRIHASITLENSHFYLQDNHSKFGTLVLLDQEINLNSLSTFCGIQIGSNLFRVHSSDAQEISDNNNNNNNNPIILRHPSNSIFIRCSSQSIIMNSEEEIENNQEEEKSMGSHDPYVFDEAPELSVHSFTTQQLRKTQFPSFESSKFKIVETHNQIQVNPNCSAKPVYMPSNELLQQLSSNQMKY
eukprot:TRINITY_DN904_c0_g2_i3.p1 TRINITY_DN904_c0_g2~~TRINITY_DN904_c0_g2_i3.p1  ORF type:complete len:260 (+),score=40.51 TRINITY_DN904_c0_g2_i3:3-782(+)